MQTDIKILNTCSLQIMLNCVCGGSQHGGCCTRMQADKHNAVTASNNRNMNLMNITQEALTNHPVNDTGVISENLCCVKIHHSRATRSALPKVHVCTFGWCHVPSEKPTGTFFYWSTKEKEAVIAEDSSCAWASGSTTSGWRVLEILLITEKNILNS